MKVCFRADASIQMGTGHLIRCLNLAEALRKKGANVHFICRAHKGSLVSLIEQRNFTVSQLPCESVEDNVADEDYRAWLGTTPADDAEQTIAVLESEKPDWLVVDHYGLDIEWERLARPHARNILVIDDLANRDHDCDILLDHNYSDMGEGRYAARVPKFCKLLLGPHYALLQPEYALYRKSMKERDGSIKRILVFFGGSDPNNITKMAIEAILIAAPEHLEADIVIGANNNNLSSLTEHFSNEVQLHFFGHRDHLADLMAKADIAIGAIGGTTWERMCMGLPTLAISLTENQRPTADALARAGLIRYAGHITEINVEQLVSQLNIFNNDSQLIAEMSAETKKLVDGLGAARVAEEMCLRCI